MPKRRIAKGAARSRAQIEAQLKAAKRSAELRRKHGSATGPSAKRGLLRVDTSQPSGKADRVALKETIGEGKTGPTGKRGKGGVARGRLSLSASAKVGRENVINDKDRVAYRAAGAESRKLKVKLGEHAPTADRIYSVAKRLAKVREGGNDVKIGDISKSAQAHDPSKPNPPEAKKINLAQSKADLIKQYLQGQTTQHLKDDIRPRTSDGRALVVDPDYVDAIKAEIAKRETTKTTNAVDDSKKTKRQLINEFNDAATSPERKKAINDEFHRRNDPKPRSETTTSEREQLDTLAAEEVKRKAKAAATRAAKPVAKPSAPTGAHQLEPTDISKMNRAELEKHLADLKKSDPYAGRNSEISAANARLRKMPEAPAKKAEPSKYAAYNENQLREKKFSRDTSPEEKLAITKHQNSTPENKAIVSRWRSEGLSGEARALSRSLGREDIFDRDLRGEGEFGTDPKHMSERDKIIHALGGIEVYISEEENQYGPNDPKVVAMYKKLSEIRKRLLGG